MFVPIEGAYSLAMQHDRELLSYAWDKKIIIVCPTTLFATLRTIASMWRLELQNQNAQEIAKRGGALYDKIAGFIEDMTKLGKQIITTQNTYDDAINKLTQGRGNILRQAEQLKELGAKASKNITLISDGEEKPIDATDNKPGNSLYSGIRQSYAGKPIASANCWWKNATQSINVAQASQSAISTNSGTSPTAMIASKQQQIFNPYSKRFALNYAFIGVLLVWLWHPTLKIMLTGIGTAPSNLFL